MPSASLPPAIREADMYPLLRDWLEANGCRVNAEVGRCDIAAQKDGGVIVVEMKTRISLELLLQVADRQKIAASVYAAVPSPRLWDKRWRRLMHLVRRLEAGLLVVHLSSAVPRVEVAFHPTPCSIRRDKAGSQALLTEMAGRSMEMNVAGTRGVKRVTAYRESALLVAAALEQLGPSSPAALRRLGTGEKTLSLLYTNPYGWFERLGKGVYGLTAAGREGMAAYNELADILRQRLAKDNALTASQ